MAISYTFFIADCGMGSRVNLFLVLICAVLRMVSFHLTCKFTVGPSYMSLCNLSAMVLVGVLCICSKLYSTVFGLVEGKIFHDGSRGLYL